MNLTRCILTLLFHFLQNCLIWKFILYTSIHVNSWIFFLWWCKMRGCRFIATTTIGKFYSCQCLYQFYAMTLHQVYKAHHTMLIGQNSMWPTIKSFVMLRIFVSKIFLKAALSLSSFSFGILSGPFSFSLWSVLFWCCPLSFCSKAKFSFWSSAINQACLLWDSFAISFRKLLIWDSF